jgi:hypothetical protein
MRRNIGNYKQSHGPDHQGRRISALLCQLSHRSEVLSRLALANLEASIAKLTGKSHLLPVDPSACAQGR